MSDLPREIDEKKLQEIFQRMSQNRKNWSREKSLKHHEHSSSSENKTGGNSSSGTT